MALAFAIYHQPEQRGKRKGPGKLLLLCSLLLALCLVCATLRVLSDGMAKHSKLQSTLEYSLARVILSSLGALPRRAAITAGIGVSRIAYLLLGGLRRTGQRNLEIAFPDMDQ